MESYKKIVKKVMTEGEWKFQRAVDKDGNKLRTLSTTGYMFEHNMFNGFPLLTTKKMGMKMIAAELEFFIKGLSSKSWLQERNCSIWDEWCNPKKVSDRTDHESMKLEDDLGRIYGVQWRAWRTYGAMGNIKIDQLKGVLETLKNDPTSRRMIVSAWNPADLDEMALPPCHYGFQLLSDGHNVDLLWNQRSVDVGLGLPYNIASYALLLKLIARHVGMQEGKLIGFLADTHIYENHMPQLKEQITREEYSLPDLEITNESTDIFDWEYTDIKLSSNYKSHTPIKMEVAI